MDMPNDDPRWQEMIAGHHDSAARIKLENRFAYISSTLIVRWADSNALAHERLAKSKQDQADKEKKKALEEREKKTRRCRNGV
jgi:hypothetical protein